MTKHIILTGKDGELRTPAAGDADEVAGSGAEIDAMIAKAVETGRLVLYFHGGLVTETAGFANARRLGAVFEKAGAYPVSFVWRSGALEIISSHLIEIAREDIFERLLRRVLSWAVGKARDLGDGRGAGVQKPSSAELDDELEKRLRHDDPDAGEEPFSAEEPPRDGIMSTQEQNAFLAEVDADAALREDLAAVLSGADLEAVGADGRSATPTATPVPTRMDRSVLVEISAGDPADGRGVSSLFVLAKKALEVLGAVLQRYRWHTDSGLYPTVVDELLRAFYLGDIGGAVWHEMKKETSDTFARTGHRGGTLLLDALAARLPADGSVPITLVGHSTGAVFIDHLLREVVRRRTADDHPLPDATRFQIALLAPAATTRHFAEAMADAADLVHGFRMFTMSDAAERADRVAGAVYPRSLLYLVAGALERDDDVSAYSAVIGLQRYLGDGYDDLLGSDAGRKMRLGDTRTYFGVADRVVLSPTVAKDARVGFRASARSHGDFDSDPAVLESVSEMIRSW